jgi:hypothetical protein
MLLVDVGHAHVAANVLSLPHAARAGSLTGGDEVVVRTVRSLIGAAVREAPAAGTRRVAIPGSPPINVVVGSDAETLIDALAAIVRRSQAAGRGGLKALQAAARDAVTSPAVFARLSKSAQNTIEKVRESSIAAGQGIVVGGTTAGTIQILDNVVEDTVQGIHVGVSDPHQPGAEVADAVMIARNHVHALVPRLYDRDRHAVFVGNARSVHVVDTVATLRRLGVWKAPPTPVEAIRIHGELGQFLCVRQSSLRDFTVGVRVVPVGTPSPKRLWLVAETMAAGSSTALLAPPDVDRERNFP